MPCTSKTQIAKVGGNRVLHSNVYIVPIGEEIEFEAEIAPTDILKCRIQLLEQENPEGGEKKSSIESLDSERNDGFFLIRMVNVGSSLGSSLTKPFDFALSDNDEPIYMMAIIYKWSNIYKVDLQITISEIKI